MHALPLLIRKYQNWLLQCQDSSYLFYLDLHFCSILSFTFAQLWVSFSGYVDGLLLIGNGTTSRDCWWTFERLLIHPTPFLQCRPVSPQKEIWEPIFDQRLRKSPIFNPNVETWQKRTFLIEQGEKTWILIGIFGRCCRLLMDSWWVIGTWYCKVHSNRALYLFEFMVPCAILLPSMHYAFLVSALWREWCRIASITSGMANMMILNSFILE